MNKPYTKEEIRDGLKKAKAVYEPYIQKYLDTLITYFNDEVNNLPFSRNYVVLSIRYIELAVLGKETKKIYGVDDFIRTEATRKFVEMLYSQGYKSDDIHYIDSVSHYLYHPKEVNGDKILNGNIISNTSGEYLNIKVMED